MSGARPGGRDRDSLLSFRESTRAAMRMRELRRAAKITQRELAQKLGWTASSVAKREQGATPLSAAEARGVAAVLGTSLEDLTGGSP
jgi:transcriptional regulator with XRE-family HTH domain